MSAPSESIRLFLAGDVMLGRGIDQILPHPCDPRIYEDFMTSAEGYVRLAEKKNGPIPRNAGFEYVWGDLLTEEAYRKCDLRIVNLETSITTFPKPEPKGINYRMNPGNVGTLQAASIDACTLANNHIIDWGREGLADTLDTLAAAGIASAGAGRTGLQAAAPAEMGLPQGGRVIILAFGCVDSGIPRHWAAGSSVAGLNLLPDNPDMAAQEVLQLLDPIRRSGDIVIVSVHWGDNWGFTIPLRHRKLAHALIEAGAADVIFGHSSHHAKGLEVHAGKLVLYGCGDLINDYEGIGGYDQYRGDLAQAYFVALNPNDGSLESLEIKQYQRRNFRLNRSGGEALNWLKTALRGPSGAKSPQFTKADAHSLRMV